MSVDTSAKAENDVFEIKHVAHVVLVKGSCETDKLAAEQAIQTADKVCVVGNLAKKAGVTIDVVPDIRIA